MRTTRRNFIRISLLAGTAALTASCQPRAVEEVVKEVAVSPTEKGLSGKIVSWQSSSAYFSGATDIWNERHPEAQVEVVRHRDDVKWEAALRSGSGEADIVQSDPHTICRHMLHEQLYDWTDRMDQSMRDGFVQFKLKECTHPKKEKIYGFPFQLGVVGIYYREDILEKVGYDNDMMQDLSWEEYIELGRKLKKDFDIALEYAMPDQTTYFTMLLWLAGGALTNREGTEVTLDSSIAKDVMTRIKMMYDEGLISSELPRMDKTWWSACAEGKVATIWAAAWTNGYFEQNITSSEAGQGMWRNAPLPYLEKGGARAVNSGGSPMETAAYTQNPDLCWEVQKFGLSTVEGALACARLGTVLCWQPMLDTQEFKEVPFKFAGDWHINEVSSRYAADVPLTYHFTPVYQEGLALFNDWHARIINGELTVDEGLAKAADHIREANEKWVRILDAE